MSVTHAMPGLVVCEHELSVPLDHGASGGARITVFAREVCDPDGRDRPLLVYFQGGPGFESPRPTGAPAGPGWLTRALKDFRVLLLDQRGTGRSTPVGTLAGSAEEQAEYLSHFRADSIVRDAEAFRAELGVDRWSVLGQSFGGLCVFTYLSLAPDALREAFVTGGVPPLGNRIDEVYAATYARTQERSRRYYERYPEDRDRVRALLDLGLPLPGGDVLTAERVRWLGNELGMSDGAEAVHHLLELDPASPMFAHDVQAALPFARNPIYAVLHEACWADGGTTRWAAERVMPDAFREDPTVLTGEHIYSWMFENVGALAPLRDAAELLAQREWGRLYDPDVLAGSEVPVAAAIYANDMYVERTFSEETAAQVPNVHAWVTSEYEHNGLRADGGRILGRLIDMARGRA